MAGWCGDRDILLGPERTTVGLGFRGCGPGFRGLVVVSGRCHLLPNCVRDTVVFVGRGWWVWVVGGVLFENCTVDASIFVVKFVRANGGCLGTRSR